MPIENAQPVHPQVGANTPENADASGVACRPRPVAPAHIGALIPSGRLLLNSRFEKVIELADGDRPEITKRDMIRAAAGDSPSNDRDYYATGRHIRLAGANCIVATVCDDVPSSEQLAADLASRASSTRRHAA